MQINQTQVFCILKVDLICKDLEKLALLFKETVNVGFKKVLSKE